MNPEMYRSVEQQLGLTPDPSNDKNDLISRVFHDMVRDFLKKIPDLLGLHVSAYSWITEFQKRGLPHIHMALRCPELGNTCDEYNNNHILNKLVKRCYSNNPELNSLISKLMIYKCAKGTCGGDQLNPNLFKKGSFPRPAKTFFTVNDNKRIIPQGGYDDRMTVSFNPTLLYRYGSHVNLDAFGSEAVLAYLFKYITKGQDRIYISPSAYNPTEDEPRDRIKDVVENKFMSGIEGSYFVLTFQLLDASMFMMKLASL